MKEWTSNRLVNMVGVTDNFYGVSWVTFMSMSLISSMELTSNISPINFAMVEGS